VGTLLGAAEMLLSGVTSVADQYFHMDRAFEAYGQAGMRADLSWAVFGTGEDWQEQVEQSLAEHGKMPVKVLRDTGVLRPGTIPAHAYYATNNDLELIRDSDAGVAHCAKTYLKFGDVNDFLPRALAAGVKVGLGTDGPCSNNTLSILEATRDAAFIAKSARDDAEVAPIAEVLPPGASGWGNRRLSRLRTD
jgi:cytosine/adenosine deaminase-related metal-dependent hydrolase